MLGENSVDRILERGISVPVYIRHTWFGFSHDVWVKRKA